MNSPGLRQGETQKVLGTASAKISPIALGPNGAEDTARMNVVVVLIQNVNVVVTTMSVWPHVRH